MHTRTHAHTQPRPRMHACHAGDNEDYQNHQPGETAAHATEYLMHFPGFSHAAAQLLVAERGVAGIGIDTLSTDVGTTKTFPVHHCVLGAGGWQPGASLSS